MYDLESRPTPARSAKQSRTLAVSRAPLDDLIGELDHVVVRQQQPSPRAQYRESAAEVYRQARVAERSRLSRDLHDSASQHVAVLLLNAKLLERHLTSFEGERQLARLVGHIDRLAESMHQVVHDLRPRPLEKGDLPGAIETHLEEWSCLTGIATRFECGSPVFSTPQVALTLFRVVQESLTNVVKHASGASLVIVRLSRKRGRLVLGVTDNGSGLPAQSLSHTDCQTQRRFGVTGMRERLAHLSGTLRLFSPTKRGLTLCAIVPEASLGAWNRERP